MILHRHFDLLLLLFVLLSCFKQPIFNSHITYTSRSLFGMHQDLLFFMDDGLLLFSPCQFFLCFIYLGQLIQTIADGVSLSSSFGYLNGLITLWLGLFLLFGWKSIRFASLIYLLEFRSLVLWLFFQILIQHAQVLFSLLDVLFDLCLIHGFVMLIKFSRITQYLILFWHECRIFLISLVLVERKNRWIFLQCNLLLVLY